MLHFTFQLLASVSVSMLVSVANRAIWFRFAGFPELDFSLGIASSSCPGKRFVSTVLGTLPGKQQSGFTGATPASYRGMYSPESASHELALMIFGDSPSLTRAGTQGGAGRAEAQGVPARLDFQCIDSTAVGKSIDVCWSLPFDGPRV